MIHEKSNVTSVNPFSFLGDDEENESHFFVDPAASKKKKKKRNKKKKKNEQETSNYISNLDNPGSNGLDIDLILERCRQIGFSRREIEDIVEKKWINNEPVDPNSIAEYLQELKKKEAMAVEKEPRSQGLVSAVELQMQSTDSSPEMSSKTISESNGNDTEDGSEGSEEDDMPSNSELSLSKRLEIAASHDNLEAALIGLVAWAEMSSGKSDVDLLFTSKALPMLFENILSTCPPKGSVDDKLYTLFSASLPVGKTDNLDDENDAAKILVARIRSILDGVEVFKIKNEIPITSLSNYLTDVVCKFRVKTMGTPGSVATELSSLNLQIDANRTQQSNIHSNDTKDVFQMRDLRSNMVGMLSKKCSVIANLCKTHGVMDENMDTDASSDEKNPMLDEFLQSINAPDMVSIVREKAQLAHYRLNGIKAKSEEKSKPILDLLNSNKEKICALETKRDQLIAELKLTEEKINECKQEREKLKADKREVTLHFEKETEKFDSENNGALYTLQRLEARENIYHNLVELKKSLASVASFFSSDIQETLQVALPVTYKQFFQSVYNYVNSESACMKFMKNRVDESTIKLLKLDREILEYSSLGMRTVSSELEASSLRLRKNIEEDKSCLSALYQRAQEVHSCFRENVLKLSSKLGEDTVVSDVLFSTKKSFLNMDLGKDWDLPVSIKRPQPKKTDIPPSQSTPNKAISNESTESKSSSIVKESSFGGVKKSDHVPIVSAPAKPTKTEPKLQWVSAVQNTDQNTNSKGKTIYEIQAEELEGRLTKENIARLEKGMKPKRSPLLEKIRILQGDVEENVAAAEE